MLKETAFNYMFRHIYIWNVKYICKEWNFKCLFLPQSIQKAF